jgi:phage terminase large subunit-like protein
MDAQELLDLYEYNKKFYRLADYEPYPFQLEFHHKHGHNTPGIPAIQPAIVAANKVGKTWCAAAEVAYHTTGKYPSWWKGRRIVGPNTGVVAGASNDTTRDVPQAELVGPPKIESEWGTAAIPKEFIGKITRKQGIPNAFDSVLVKHHDADGDFDGWSQINFRAYEQSKDKFMGFHVDWAWLDEEPPQDIFSQILRATLVTKAPVMMTFTPENGATELVTSYLTDDLPTGAALITATWDDAPHFDDPGFREAVLSRIPPHEREMRSKGIPVMGSGLVFPVLDDDIAIEPFEIPAHWPRIGAMDWGQDHKAAFVLVAFDLEQDMEYVYAAQGKTGLTISTFASMIKLMLGPNRWIPIVWPHDVNKREPTSGKTLQSLFVTEGLNMLTRQFTNPPGPGQKEHMGGNSVEAGLMVMLNKMDLGQYKVFKTCPEWFKEKGVYHRKDGKVVDRNDDIMSASRYASQSRRFAQTKPVLQSNVAGARRGGSNW